MLDSGALTFACARCNVATLRGADDAAADPGGTAASRIGDVAMPVTPAPAARRARAPGRLAVAAPARPQLRRAAVRPRRGALLDAFADQRRRLASGELTIAGVAARASARHRRTLGRHRAPTRGRSKSRAGEIAGQRETGVRARASGRGCRGAAFAPGGRSRAMDRVRRAWFARPAGASPRWRGAPARARDRRAMPPRPRAGSHELARLRRAGAPARPRPQPPLVEAAPRGRAEWRDQWSRFTDAIARGACSKIGAVGPASSRRRACAPPICRRARSRTPTHPRAGPARPAPVR